MNKYAAVLIPTLNRFDHFKNTVTSLKNCIDAEKTDVYIGLDFPPSEDYYEGYKKICDYLENEDFSSFGNFRVIKMTENYGVFKNFKALREEAFTNHDTFITMQDDIEVSKNFLSYINSALQYYENDADVVAVSGYSYPLQWRKTEGSNSLKTNYVAAEWGIGFWKDKFLELERVLENDYLYKSFVSAYKGNKLKYMIDACVKDYSNTVLNLYYQTSLLKLVCDISMRAYLPIADKYVIMPTLSCTRNHGFDGSGLYCGNIAPCLFNNNYADTYDYDSQPIDDSDNYVFRPSSSDFINENRDLLNTFDRRDQKEMRTIHKRLKRYVFLGPSLYRGYLHIRSLYRGVIFKTKQIFKH